MQREPVTIAEAAERLGKPERTVRTWASRYRALRLFRPGSVGRTAQYDWFDLSTIGRCIHLGEPVPATTEERDALRAALFVAA